MLLVMEAVAAADLDRMDAQANFPGAGHESHRCKNPYANGYMGAAGGSNRIMTLWRSKNRVAPAN